MTNQFPEARPFGAQLRYASRPNVLQRATCYASNKLSNNRRLFSTSTKPRLDDNNYLDPNFITGISDAEGSFVCIIRKNSNSRLGWRVEVIFQIASLRLHRKDLELLKLIKAYFGNTGIISESELMCAFRVSSPKQILEQVINHFDKYPLISKKYADYSKKSSKWVELRTPE